ncbi:hypothetical protein B0H63DRAFT_57803 [Podospora didyma]|uniref:Uncharacterized protein n=1 Tax=Podospora didyma TaxID=330526 RepID=A0AAE0P7M5_9PEZI|nr:hypothetical protein B0H63DRAFT_57803 [Podospora didyma]
MGVSMSTLGGWALILCVAGYYAFYNSGGQRNLREKARAASQRQKLEDRQTQPRKDSKAKRQRVEAFSKDVDDSVKAAQPKQRPAKAPAPAAAPAPSKASKATEHSSDDDLDNREFARQLASIKQGTNLNAPKKSDEKRQKSVKQSRARMIEEKSDNHKVSAPSSTAGVDGDDDESSIASPEVKAADAGDVSDMLEPQTSTPQVLRLTGTDKVKQKEKKAKAPEVVETKKQRQNRLKAEAAKAERAEAEKERQVALEAQRRLARISEGRAAKDGSTSMASYAAQSAWNGNSNGSISKSESATFQPLDTFVLDTSAPKEVPAPAPTPAPKAATAATSLPKDGSWMSSLPSEEEQLKMLREDDWSTVKTKKSAKPKKKDSAAAESTNESEPTVQKATPVASPPVVAKTNGNGKPAKPFSQQSSFAALSSNDELEVENEWDV